MVDASADKGHDKKPDVKIAQGRSPAYPYIPLGEAVDRAREIHEAGATRTALPAETYYAIWKMGSQSSGARQTLAALNHFGLVDYIGRGDDRKVKLTDHALRVLLDKQPNSPERAQKLKDIATNPLIHMELFNKYGSFLPADVVLETFLTRDKGYNPQGAKALISEYKSTLEYAGLNKPANMPEADDDGLEDRPPVVAKVGDLIQWTSQGQDQFKEPRSVVGVSDDGEWLWVADSTVGIPMSEVQVVGEAGAGIKSPPPTPPHLLAALAKQQDAPLTPSEKEWARGPLSKDTSYRLIVSGDLGPKEIGKLIKVLEAQKAILADDDESALDDSTIIDVSRFEQPEKDVYILPAFRDGVDYRDVRDKAAVVSIGRHKKTGEYRAALDARFYQPNNPNAEYDCVWLK